MHKLVGAGLPNVYLQGGVTIEGNGEGQTVAYSNLDELYRELARAIAFRRGAMSGFELRFLRKRLGMTQAEVAAMGAKSEQAVAKWEKGQSPVPKAEADLLRLSVLTRFGTKEDISRVTSQLTIAIQKTEPRPYVLKFEHGSWVQDESMALQLSTVSGVVRDDLFESNAGQIAKSVSNGTNISMEQLIGMDVIRSVSQLLQPPVRTGNSQNFILQL